ncbi:AraC family transcriptional regulator [Chromobacterium sp. ATCC 53434]|uniref:helix-turn-helix transcriptional regulator n=1 Tax=Chromobacterium sp. (strain ATCC 53434 / SC 14030) TaxID=2059672 RepID=UPI0018F196B7|nr:AraC family transcriptional regulator [Chromobacterium sp. ATCC 53434]
MPLYMRLGDHSPRHNSVYRTGMPAIRLIISRSSGEVTIRGDTFPFPENCLIVTDNEARISANSHLDSVLSQDFFASELQQLHPEIIELLEADTQTVFNKEAVRLVRTERDVTEVLASLSRLAPASFLHFAYVYCLSLDRTYFSALLRSCIAGNKDFCKFIEENALQQWSVAELANQFEMPLRKFNQLFQETYGKPAKRWILEHRMSHAKKLLLTTTMRVLDIALECGFSNHAHFTDSFRRHFQCNPKQFRQQALGKPIDVSP